MPTGLWNAKGCAGAPVDAPGNAECLWTIAGHLARIADALELRPTNLPLETQDVILGLQNGLYELGPDGNSINIASPKGRG